jgi:hypothetical protein
MPERHEETARRVVKSFKEALDPRALQAITDDEFRELEILVQEALAEELHTAADRMDDVVRRLRSESDLPQLGL